MTNLVGGVIMGTDLKDPRGKLRCLQQAEDEKTKNEDKSITITLKIKENGFEFKGLENIKSRPECIWLLLSAKWLENRAVELGYLPELKRTRKTR